VFVSIRGKLWSLAIQFSLNNSECVKRKKSLVSYIVEKTKTEMQCARITLDLWDRKVWIALIAWQFLKVWISRQEYLASAEQLSLTNSESLNRFDIQIPRNSVRFCANTTRWKGWQKQDTSRLHESL
jgi:hypothetical protein